jgi:hypothetical protein
MEKRVNIEDWSLALQGLLEDSQIELTKILSTEDLDREELRSYDSSLSLLMEEIAAVLKSDRKIRIKAAPDRGWTEYEVKTSIGITNYDMWRFDAGGVTLRSIQSIEVVPSESDRVIADGWKAVDKVVKDRCQALKASLGIEDVEEIGVVDDYWQIIARMLNPQL